MVYSDLFYYLSFFVISVHSTDLSASRRAREDVESDSYQIKRYYVLEHCHKTILYYYYYDDKDAYIPVVRSIKLQLDRNKVLGEQYVQLKCHATLSAGVNHRLMVHFNSVNINSKFQPYIHERLHIFDGKTKKDLTPYGLEGNYSNDKKSSPEYRLADYVSNGSTLLVYFEGIPTYSSFDAIVTSFLDPLKNGTCPKGYFRCKIKNICILGSLQCDGYSNCGNHDDSDEEKCFYDGSGLDDAEFDFDSENLGLVVGSSVSLLVLLVVVVWFSVICIKRAILRRDLHRSLYLAASPGIEAAPDPHRVYIPPTHAAMAAMVCPPPLYSPRGEAGDLGVTAAPVTDITSVTMELPPPYSSSPETSPTTDREYLIRGDRRSGRPLNNNTVLAVPALSASQALPPYTSVDDLPSYSTATAAAGDSSPAAAAATSRGVSDESGSEEPPKQETRIDVTMQGVVEDRDKEDTV